MYFLTKCRDLPAVHLVCSLASKCGGRVHLVFSSYWSVFCKCPPVSTYWSELIPYIVARSDQNWFAARAILINNTLCHRAIREARSSTMMQRLDISLSIFSLPDIILLRWVPLVDLNQQNSFAGWDQPARRFSLPYNHFITRRPAW